MTRRVADAAASLSSSGRHDSLVAHICYVGGSYIRAFNESREERAHLKRDAALNPASVLTTYRDMVNGYNLLKGGTASTASVDDLRRKARLLLNGSEQCTANQLRQVRALLGWLDHARTAGRITIEVRQLRERKKWGSWAMECGVTAGGVSAKVKKSVKGDTDVAGCAVNVPWNPDASVTVWMHLTDAGYEGCWGHVGPVGFCSETILHEKSGLVREFCADEFDKDFRLRFAISRNFGALPMLEQ
jgi:hypothetical protein